MANSHTDANVPVLPHVWIIGASAGIGKALALLLAEKGYQLAISGRNQTDLVKLHQHLPTHLTNHGSNHLVVPCDVSNLQSLATAHSDILSQWPRIDRIILMAGIYEPMVMSELQDQDILRIEQVIQINLTSAFYLTKVALPRLLADSATSNQSSETVSQSARRCSAPDHNKSAPQLIFCASVAGYVGLPNGQPYSATKAALINYAQSLRAEYWPSVDIKIISPGFVQTRLTDKNKFKMPMIITPEYAAEAIYAGLNQPQRFEIHFPRRFSIIMKCLGLLPYRLFFWLTRRMR